jgi:site-specific DNA-cytosine methylase
MKALGMICGVGSMLIGAKRQGYDIVGNIEWRQYYHSGTFEHNFPGSFMVDTLKDLTHEQIESCKDLDLIIGHTECGNFSNMRANKNNAIDAGDKGDIPQFVEAVQTLQPKFFVMDNLPKSLIVADWSYYMDALPDYDIHFEWVNNYGYGNVQKNRKRLFIIGSKRELEFYFIPGEFEHNTSVLERISEISPDAENNDSLDLDEVYGGWGRYQFDKDYIERPIEENRLTLRAFQELIKDYPNNINFPYFNKKGEQKFKIGFSKINVNGPAMVLSGGGACFDNHFRSDTLYPFTIRERAKIQGCPDDFVFFPKGVTKTGKQYGSLIKQTGKFMPVEFCTFVTGQIKSFLDGTRKDDDYTQKRYLNPNEFVDKNKYEFCQMAGYTNDLGVCNFCGSKKYCKLKSKENGENI